MGVSPEALRRDSNTINGISKDVGVFLDAIWSILPNEFSAKYKNFCWYQGPTLHCLPYFFIAGFPKSGTTSLYSAVVNHPEIFDIGKSRKEPHWWTRRHVRKTNFTTYFRKFSRASQNISLHADHVFCDASQSTLWDSAFFANGQDYCAMTTAISRVLPDAKFIVLMRNPVTRIHSHYLWSCSYALGNDTSIWPSKVYRNARNNFHDMVLSGIKTFNNCLHDSSLYECTNVMTSNFKAMRWQESCGYITHQIFVGLYYVHIFKWLQFYLMDNFLFLRTEDMGEPEQLMSVVTDFLGVEKISSAEAQQWLGKRANTQEVVHVESPEFQMRNDTRKLLEDFYQPYNILLAELLKDNRFLWED